MVFAREVEGRELTFGVSGKLIMNAVVLYDHQTDTLWSQFLAEAVEGELAGTRLELLPAQLTAWEAWAERYPDTLALDKRLTARLADPTRLSDPYEGYYRSDRAGILGEANSDDRLPRKALVVGLDWGAAPRAYALAALSGARVVNDSYGGRPIVVTYDAGSGAHGVFSREVEGRTLTLRPSAPLLMEDEETGTTWEQATGAATAGPLDGARLPPLRSFIAYWFAWTDFHPDTELYAAGEEAGRE